MLPKWFAIHRGGSGNVILSGAKDLAIARHQENSPRRTPRDAEEGEESSPQMDTDKIGFCSFSCSCS